MDCNREKILTPAANAMMDLIHGKADPNAHGGCYVGDEDGLLHVNLVEGRENALNLTPADGIVFHVVKYSWTDLDEARKQFANANDCPSWFVGSSIDVMKNQVQMFVLENQKHKRTLPVNAIADADMVYDSIVAHRFGANQEESETIREEADARAVAAKLYTHNGGKWYPQTGGNSSLAAGIQWWQAGNFYQGWLTTTHGAASGRQAYYYGKQSTATHMGTVVYVCFDETHDFSIIRRDNADMGALDINLGGGVTNLQGGWPAVNGTTILSGHVLTQNTGICLSNSYSGWIGNDWKSDHMVVSNPCYSGDSGGPMLFKSGNLNSLGGIISAYNTDWPGYNRVTICTKFNLARTQFRNFDIVTFS